MRNLLRKKFLGIPIAVIAVILVAAVALAAWSVGNLTSTGSITSTEAPPSQTYNLDTNVLVFGDTTAVEGGAINVTSGVITLTNTGEADIGSIAVVVSDLPTGITTGTPNVTATYPLETNDTATFTVTLAGTMGSHPTTIDLTDVTATVTPGN